ncbi:MAG TPA: uridine kinase [Pseudonocardiaceae bacterium]|nr:uridine kinase [Pseudonocardiaceae bacterium]
MRFRPVSPDKLVAELADTIVSCGPDRRLAVIIDGAPPAAPGQFADTLVDPVRVRGRPVLRVSTTDFLRPASLRYERGRIDPDARYEDWLDLSGLAREVFAPVAPGGSGQVLPSLWDERTDRASRARYVKVPANGVVLVDGSLLLGRVPRPDLAVHLLLSAGALERGTPTADRWTLPAFTRYYREIDPPALADVVIRTDDPRHPAIWVAGKRPRGR